MIRRNHDRRAEANRAGTADPPPRREGIPEISVVEFGVAGGNGVLALERWAAAVEREVDVGIAVYGFDTGAGLPELCGDYRDHPDKWRPSDYPMDVEALRRRIGPRTQLVLGNTRETAGVREDQAEISDRLCFD